MTAQAAGALKGKEVYDRYCAWCHGVSGAGDGPAAQHLNPAPRDFTPGVYKWKSTPFDEISPSDSDLYRMIAGHGKGGFDGLPGTSMPGWSDTLGDGEIKEVAGYVKSLSGLEINSKPHVSLAGGIKPSVDSTGRGRKLFLDRCSDCHGAEGRGDAIKALKDDWGARTWPRDLTKGWTFRGGSDRKDIYTRITVGIPGTQMPSFADPRSKKAMTEGERWDVANYVASLDEPAKRPGADTVIRAVRAKTPLPSAPDDLAWKDAGYASLRFFPQMITGETFPPSLDSVSVKGLYNETEAAFLLEWDDTTESIPKDPMSEKIAGGAVFNDAVAVQFALSGVPGGRLPYLGMGDAANPVEIWSWRNADEKGLARGRVFTARGPGRIKAQAASGLYASGVYDKGVWKVVMKGAVKGAEAGRFTPIALAAWDGSNRDMKGRHVLTAWTYLYMEPVRGFGVYLWPVAAAFAVFFSQFLLSRRRP